MLEENTTQENIEEINKRQDKELLSRKIYFFTCEKCGHHKRQSFRRSKAEVGLCRKCRQAALLVHKNQGSLFANDQTYANSSPIPQQN